MTELLEKIREERVYIASDLIALDWAELAEEQGADKYALIDYVLEIMQYSTLKGERI